MAPSRGLRDLSITVVSFLLLIGWDASGADLEVARVFASGSGFAARDSWVASTLLHSGGRWLAWSLAASLLLVALRTPVALPGRPNREQRLRWLAAMLLCALAVPALKRSSATSCAWDLKEFGGTARYLSHWHWGVADGGPGHCFPSGHAVAAFAFLGMYFAWREHDRLRARAWLVGVLTAGTLFGVAQLVRGAHYPSHSLWSAWLCWTLCVIVATAARSRRSSGMQLVG